MVFPAVLDGEEGFRSSGSVLVERSVGTLDAVVPITTMDMERVTMTTTCLNDHPIVLKEGIGPRRFLRSFSTDVSVHWVRSWVRDWIFYLVVMYWYDMWYLGRETDVGTFASALIAVVERGVPGVPDVPVPGILSLAHASLTVDPTPTTIPYPLDTAED